MLQPNNAPRIKAIAAAMFVFCGRAEASPNDLILRGEGTIKDANAPADGVLFKIAYEHTIKNGKPVSTLIRQSDLKGKILVEEETTYDSDGRFNLYTMAQHQTGDRTKVEVSGNQVVMAFTENGETTVSKEQYSNDLNAPGSLMSYMSGYTDQLEKGQKIPLRLAVAERGMVLGFEIKNENKDCRSSGGDLCVNLQLSNFFLKKLLKPVFMSFRKSPQGYRPLIVETPAVVRRMKGSSLEKFTARIEYLRH